MKVVGIIAEYNPFHKGHAYQIRYAKERLGADYVIVAMSGPFTQRGTPALFDKYSRAGHALACGADLVLELPVVYATASAQVFATGGVALLQNAGLVDTLLFGSECPDLAALKNIADMLSEETPCLPGAPAPGFAGGIFLCRCPRKSLGKSCLCQDLSPAQQYLSHRISRGSLPLRFFHDTPLSAKTGCRLSRNLSG